MICGASCCRLSTRFPLTKIPTKNPSINVPHLPQQQAKTDLPSALPPPITFPGRHPVCPLTFCCPLPPTPVHHGCPDSASARLSTTCITRLPQSCQGLTLQPLTIQCAVWCSETTRLREPCRKEVRTMALFTVR